MSMQMRNFPQMHQKRPIKLLCWFGPCLRPYNAAFANRYLVFFNLAPLFWCSKKQNMVESSTFGDKFVALWIATKLLLSLCYDLRMFGIPVNEPTNVFFDNEAYIYQVSTKKENANWFVIISWGKLSQQGK